MESRYTESFVLDLARQAYERGAARFDVVAERCALLVIDMQDEFVRPGWTPFWVPEATRQAPRIRRLIDACRSLGVPVVYTVFSRTHEFLDRPRSGPSMPNRYPELEHDEEWFREGRVWHELAPEPGDVVIHKPSYGAFYDTPLETILRNLGRDTILICGTLTNYCCGTTARQGYERGFRVVVGSDVCATDDPEMQEPELAVLRKGFARVLSADEIVSALGRASEAGTREELR
ncbi:MAG: cysteine hydrolase family protein [Gemmatimonadota bacterium]